MYSIIRVLRLKYPMVTLAVLGMALASIVSAEPIEEAFLLFLAEMVEVDGELIDPLAVEALEMEEGQDMESEPVMNEKGSKVSTGE